MSGYGFNRLKNKLRLLATDKGDQYVADATIYGIGGHTTVTTTTLQTLTAPSGCRGILIQAFTQPSRYTFDSATAPTAVVGFRITLEDGPVFIPLAAGAKIYIISEVSGGSIQYQWTG